MNCRPLSFIALLLLGCATPALAGGNDEIVTSGSFGQVHIYRQSAKPANVVLFVSGDGGWNQGVVQMAKSLADMDTLVAGIDITHYLRQTATANNDCTYSAGDLQGLSQALEAKYGYDHYVEPVLVGYSSGATLAYGALVQGPPSTFAGAISLGFCPDLLSPKPLCKGAGLTHTEDPKHKNTHVYDKAASTPSPWVAIQGEIDEVCSAATTKTFVGGIANASLVSLPNVGHGFSVEKNWMPQFKDSFQHILHRKTAEDAVNPKPDSLADLPLVENGLADPKGKPLAVIVTGDGGWASIDRDIGGAMNKSGVNVVGLNSLQYFWSEKTPEQSARDLDRILRWYEDAWQPSSIMLIGYSLGADALPFMVNNLPADQQSRIATVAMLAVGHDATLVVHVSDWLFSGKHDGLPIKPEADKIAAANRMCFYGEEEAADSLCPTLDAARFTIIKTKGGHHFDGDYNFLAGAILKASNSAL
ncbi:MAG TPA: AcvB/VirJ family lysyl-phosphatidylglycerol hydrolase [Dongiaceae bacterium]|nr:AcvB/VirJ family lysyl-phosphatidylglycerol hydrolase [Dongiaceae bacterium]